MAEPLVEPQGGFVEVVEAEPDLSEAAVTGPVLAFGHQARSDAALVLGLGDGGFLIHGVASGRQDRDIRCFKTLEGLDPH